METVSQSNHHNHRTPVDLLKDIWIVYALSPRRRTLKRHRYSELFFTSRSLLHR